MDLLQKIVAHAKSNKQRIVLPEATEERTLKAADRVLADDIADIILIGNPGEISRLAQQWGLSNIQKATIIDPENNPKSELYAEKLAEIRKSKGMTIEEARRLVRNPLYLGCMIIKLEEADGQVSGALSTTGETLRPALQIIKCAPGVTCVSGAMLVITHEHRYGEDGIFVMGDVAVTPVPTAEQLAQIAVCTAQTARTIAGITDPRVAMLSFSTKGTPSMRMLTRWWRLHGLPTSSILSFILTESCRRMRLSCRAWERKRRREAPSPDMPTCSLCPTSRWETYRISLSSVLETRWR